MKKNTTIDGIAASEHLDSSGESLSIEGMDISSLGGPDSILNWEHGSKDRPSQVVGKVTFAKKIMKSDQAKTKREKYFWNKVKKPFVYIKAELFDGIGHSGAQDVAAMLRYKNKDKGEDSRLVVGFSIEGGKMEKKGMVVTKSIARDVAITVKPCNKVCDAELLENESGDEDFLYKNQEFDCEILEKGSIRVNSSGYRDLIISDIKKSTILGKGDPSTMIQNDDLKGAISEIPKKPKRQVTGGDINYDMKTYETDNSMRKALIAGMMGGTPDSKSGSAALGKEDLEPTLQKPFRSKSQRRFAYANKDKFGGEEGIEEWEEETPKNIPEKFKKSEEAQKELFLEHYSRHKGLKSINPNFQGSGVDSRTRGRSLDNKISFYYPHKYENPEHRVKSTSKSKYTVKVPGDYKIFDAKVHGSDLVNKAKERNNGVFNTDHFIDVLKENGYHGFNSSPSGIKMTAMFHELPIHSEEEVDHRIKKSIGDLSFDSMAREYKDVGLENKPQMQVKTIDPNKKYKTKAGKEYSQLDLEEKKAANKYMQGQKAQAGAQSLDEFGKEDQKYIKDTAKDRYKGAADKKAAGAVISEPEFGVNEAHVKTGDMRDAKFPSTRHHEGLHRTLGTIEQKFSPKHANSLVNHIMDNFIDPQDRKGISDYVKSRYGDDPHAQEEQLTHILDILTNENIRNEHEEHFSEGGGGSINYARLKNGWKDAVKWAKGLNSKELNNINKFYNKKK